MEKTENIRTGDVSWLCVKGVSRKPRILHHCPSSISMATASPVLARTLQRPLGAALLGQAGR